MPRLIAVLACVLSSGLIASGQAPTPAGQWDGTIATPGVPLQIAVRLDQTAGAWSGSMDIPSQGLAGRALTGIGVEGLVVRFALAGIPGAPSFSGSLSDDGSQMAGEFTQGGAKLAFTLTRRTRASPPPPVRPQTPQPPFPYEIAEVTVVNAPAMVRLAGTLTTPRGPGPFTAVVLISGSGAQDRDETIAGHKPFWVLADYLSRRGVAVLRLDDRGVGGSSRGRSDPTSEDFAGDVLAAVDFLRARPGIDLARVGLIGHSEGGLIAPLVAVRSKHVAFQVLLAGSGVTGESILYEQMAVNARASGATDAQMRAARDLQERLYTVIKTEPDAARMRARIREINGEASAQALTTPWFRFFLTYDPAATLRQVTIPTLVLNGERDVQIVAAQNLPAIEAALRAAGNTQFTVRSFPGLNHLFQTSQTGLPAEYAQIEETMAPGVLETIADWIGRR